MAAVARIEWLGTPIDTDTLGLLREQWTDIRAELIRQVDTDFGVYDGQTFKYGAFADYLARHDIGWPRLSSDRLCLDDDTFKLMAGVYPQLWPLRELRKTLSQLKLNKLEVGNDGRNRSSVWGFGTKTGRNAPSTAGFIFGLPAWTRGLIKPEPGRALAYVDYEQQEFGIAAVLSKDPAMLRAYETGDAYLALAKRAGAIPQDATKARHRQIRDQYKACCIGLMYGMGVSALARGTNLPDAGARELFQAHHEAYPVFWKWGQSAVDRGMLGFSLHSVFGWLVHTSENPNPRTLLNFPMQANGAEILRLACCLMTERGINVCAPVHDAVLIEADADAIDDVVQAAQAAMLEASKVVLDGFCLRTDVDVVRYPDRYKSKRSAAMWEKVTGILRQIDVYRGGTGGVLQRGTGTCTSEVHPSNLLSYVCMS